MAKAIEIVGVFITASNGEHAGLQKFRQFVINAGLIAAVTNGAGKPTGDAEPPFGLAQQQQAAIGRQVAAIETSCELLAADGWKVERGEYIIGHGGCGARVDGSKSLRQRIATSIQCFTLYPPAYLVRHHAWIGLAGSCVLANFQYEMSDTFTSLSVRAISVQPAGGVM